MPIFRISSEPRQISPYDKKDKKKYIRLHFQSTKDN